MAVTVHAGFNRVGRPAEQHGVAEAEPPPPTQRPLVDPEPLWSGRTVPSQRLRAEFHGTVLLVYGVAPDEVHRRLLVVEPESGKPLWRLDNYGPLSSGQATFDPTPTRPSLVVGDTVLVSYRDGATVGVAALAGADGRTRWQRPIEGAPWHLLLAADDDLAVSVTPPDCCTVNDPALLPIVATDVSAGQTRRRATGSWPRFVDSGTVLGVHANSVDAALTVSPSWASTRTRKNPSVEVAGYGEAGGVGVSTYSLLHSAPDVPGRRRGRRRSRSALLYAHPSSCPPPGRRPGRFFPLTPFVKHAATPSTRSSNASSNADIELIQKSSKDSPTTTSVSKETSSQHPTSRTTHHQTTTAKGRLT